MERGSALSEGLAQIAESSAGALERSLHAHDANVELGLGTTKTQIGVVFEVGPWTGDPHLHKFAPAPVAFCELLQTFDVPEAEAL